MNSNLKIEIAENGFIIIEERSAVVDKQWAFESPQSLADFIKKWGDGYINTLPKNNNK